MKTVKKMTMMAMAMFAAAAAHAQTTGPVGGHYIPPTPPDQLAAGRAQSKVRMEAEALFAEGKLEEAIAKYRLLLSMMPGPGQRMPEAGSGASARLAKLLELADRPHEALAAYAGAIYWDAREHDWRGWSVDVTVPDYAILAAKLGHEELAKEMYYLALRNFNTGGSRFQEPVPYIVVFDPDPTMDVWTYSTNGLIAAATMLKVNGSTEGCEHLAEVKRLAPQWIVPRLYEFNFDVPGREIVGRRQELLPFARNERERQWVLSLRPLDVKDRWQTEGAELRRNSKVVQSRKGPVVRGEAMPVTPLPTPSPAG
ncbi:MAG: hypothetical protein MH204_07200 [Fimbriimonadaceae bacterium]|nr:hypothetical protein [Fimbriimonadaceae bacterium]